MCKKTFLIAIFVSTYILCWACISYAVRIKDIVDIQGVRKNQLIGYGLVFGLNGTGDGKNSEFTIQSLVSMFDKMGVTLKADDIKVNNVAAVMVTSDLPPFARAGGRIDIVVSSIGDASSLQGGTLLFTPLKGADGKVYAIAQGPISTGGFSAGGSGGNIQKNFPTVGRVAGGALIEKEIESDFTEKNKISLVLHDPDFTTASRVAEAVNTVLYDNLAVTRDSGTIDIRVPESYLGKVVTLITLIEGLNIEPDTTAKVVINERTGTVVMGSKVRVSTVAISHGNLSIEIKDNKDVSQPLPFSQGETVVTSDTNIAVKEGNSRLMIVESGISIGDLVRALNALGVSPRDLIAIFQAINAAGALQAELEII